MKKLTQAVVILFFYQFLSAQDTHRKIQFPDVDGYKTLKVDLHIHTVFSDGMVWPSIRVDEAVRDGLDAIAITDHLEYQPKKEDIPHPDRNRAFQIAEKAAKPHDLIIIPGAEITRKMPPGHANALFVHNANLLNVEDPLEAYRAAHSQGAFVFWNHPNWINQQKDAIPFLSDFHQDLIKDSLLHGMEVVNDLTYTEDGLQMAIDNNLTILGTSDIHGLVDYQFEIGEGGHRPITLLFAQEKTLESIKEALFAGRTVTWFDNMLTGKEENINLLLDASLHYKEMGYIGNSEVLEIDIINNSDARYLLKNNSDFTFYDGADIVEIRPHSKKKLKVLMSKKSNENSALEFEVLNAIIGYKKNAKWTIEF